jgi:hypothetical protein
MWGEVYKPLVDGQWPHNPHFFVENTYRFFTQNGLHQKSKL